MTDFGRDELIDARAERDRLKDAAMSSARAIDRLMEDRVRHITALLKIALMTETGIAAQGGREVHQIARNALEAEADMSWWPADSSDDSPSPRSVNLTSVTGVQYGDGNSQSNVFGGP